MSPEGPTGCQLIHRRREGDTCWTSSLSKQLTHTRRVHLADVVSPLAFLPERSAGAFTIRISSNIIFLRIPAFRSTPEIPSTASCLWQTECFLNHLSIKTPASQIETYGT